MLRSAGATVIEMPVLEIAPVDCFIDAGLLSRIGLAIFVSANAVEHGVPCLRRNGGLPRDCVTAAIGHATARALIDAGFADVVSPQQSMDSEGLLAMPSLQAAEVQGQHVLLVRGKSGTGGRKLLEDVLAARGAKVTVVDCYERRELVPPAEHIETLIETMKSNFAVMALSVETLDNLMKVFSAHETLLKSAWLLVPHARVAAAARSREFTRVAEVEMSAGALIPALIKLKPCINAQVI